METLILPEVADMHLHLRHGSLLERVARHTARRCHTALVMPNINPPIRTAEQALAYKKACELEMPNVKVLTTIKFMPDTRPEDIAHAAKAGVSAVKLYPAGMTTNSNDGIPSQILTNPTNQFIDCIDMIRRTGMTLCLHGEMPGYEVLNREAAFLNFIDFLCFNFPKLRIVLEHITTEEQVGYVERINKDSKVNMAATITAHHLWLTLDDIIGDKFKPHNFCKPIPKTSDDREALIEAAISGKPYYFLGSDSAPHLVSSKECTECCAGIYSAPVLTECLITIFERRNALEMLPNFIDGFGCDYYGVSRSNKEMRFEKSTWQVPHMLSGIVPFLAGSYLEWKIDERI